MKTRQEVFKALGEGKVLQSSTTKLFYRYIKHRLHRNENNVPKNDKKSPWQPSCLQFHQCCGSFSVV